MIITSEDVGREVRLRNGDVEIITDFWEVSEYPVESDNHVWTKKGRHGSIPEDRDYDIIWFVDQEVEKTPQPTKTNTRESILETAKQYVSKDRNATHGEPEDSFTDIAAFWSDYTGQTLTSKDVAVMMILLKCARLKTSPDNLDNWVDVAGYAACGGEVK